MMIGQTSLLMDDGEKLITVAQSLRFSLFIVVVVVERYLSYSSYFFASARLIII